MHYHEAQVSILIVGIDEWLWTTYCCVDTYFEEKTDDRTYLDGPSELDPPTAGLFQLVYPMWNPRQYYLAIVARRMMQVTREWTALVNAFEQRLMEYVCCLPTTIHYKL